MPVGYGSLLRRIGNTPVRICTAEISSVAGGGGGRGAIAPPPIGMSTKMQNRKNTTFLALLRLFYALEWTK